MKIIFTEPFLKRFKELPAKARTKFEKQLMYLASNIRHPSLHAKKYDESSDVWQARVNSFYRFYFKIDNGTLVIINIIKHPK